MTKTGVTAMDSAAGRGVQWLPGCRSETGAAQVVELLCNGGFRERNLVIASPLESGRNERGIPKLQIFFYRGGVTSSPGMTWETKSLPHPFVF